MIKRHFREAASPYLLENSRESKNVRGVYLASSLAIFVGVALFALIGGLPV